MVGRSVYPYTDMVINSFMTGTGYDFVGTGNEHEWYFSSARYDSNGISLSTPVYLNYLI